MNKIIDRIVVAVLVTCIIAVMAIAIVITFRSLS